MLQSLYTGANAINTYKNSLITSAHNIANINTPYYKSNSINLKDLQYGGVNVSSIRQNQSLSYTITSGRTLDFVIDGPGNFRLDDQGSDYYTRRGIFYLDAAGDIVDSKGRVLMPEVVEPEESIRDFEISEKGNITINGRERGRINAYDYQGNRIPDDQYRLRTGVLEASDVDIAREIVSMMAAERSMQANYANVRVNDELLGLIIDLKG